MREEREENAKEQKRERGWRRSGGREGCKGTERKEEGDGGEEEAGKNWRRS